jgi:hypothetical protein
MASGGKAEQRDTEMAPGEPDALICPLLSAAVWSWSSTNRGLRHMLAFINLSKDISGAKASILPAGSYLIGALRGVRALTNLPCTADILEGDRNVGTCFQDTCAKPR